jgi:hypothetical protein
MLQVQVLLLASTTLAEVNVPVAPQVKQLELASTTTPSAVLQARHDPVPPITVQR